MKKLLSILMVAAMLLSVMALAASAANSFVGEITVSDKVFTTPDDSDFTGAVKNPETGETTSVDLRKFEYTDKETGEKKTADLYAYIIIVPHKVLLENNAAKTLALTNTDWTSAKKITGALGETYKDYKVYTAFEVTVSDAGKAILGNTVLESINLVLNVPGLNAVTSPTTVIFDDDANKYAVDAKAKVNDSELSITVNLDAELSAYYAILNTTAEKSPETGVNPFVTTALVALFVISLAGVAFAGKKVFSNK